MTTEQIVLIVIAIFGSSGLWAFVTKVWERKQEEKKEKEEKVDPNDINLMKNAMLAMLHDSLYQSCRFYLSKGKIDEDGYTNLKTLYSSYHGLGGNGTGTELYNRTSKLKIVESIDDENQN